jgi:uncharacterized protein involved in exopolysaccharide biosynthesis
MNSIDTALPPSRPAPAGEPGDPFALPQRPRRWTLRDLAVRLFYRIRLFLFCLLLGLAGGGAAAYLSRTSYTADTLLIALVGPESATVQDTLNLANTQISVDGLKAVQSEIQIIQADGVLRAAIDALGADHLYPALSKPRLFGLLPPLDPADRTGAALERFRADLRVEAQGSSNVIRIAYTHPDRALAIRAVQQVTAAYLAHRRSIYTSNTGSVLGQELRRYGAQLERLQQDILDTRRKYDVLDMAQDIVLATNRLDGIAQRQNQVKERRVAVQTEIVAVKANLESQPAKVLDFKETTNNTGNDEARNTLVRLMQERAHLVGQYNPQWPGVKELDNKIAAARAQIHAAGGSLYFTERTIRNPAVDVLNNRLALLQVEDQALGQQLVELDSQSAIAGDRVKSLREADARLHALQLNRDVAEGVYRQLALRQPGAIAGDAAAEARDASVRVAQPPTAPLRGRSLALSFLAGGGFLGLMLGVTAVALASMMQQVYILPEDAERDLALHNVGDIDAGTRRGPRGFGLVASNLLHLGVDGRALSMVQITSPGGDAERKLAVARALGTEFAREFAMRTLILDLRENAQPPPGVPASLDPPPPVPVTASDLPDLWLSIGAHQALFGERGRKLTRAWQALDRLKQQFEMVLVVAPSAPDHPIALWLAGMVDANLLVLHAGHTRAPIAQRIRDLILEAGGNLAGFVFEGRRFHVPGWLYRRI